MNKRGQAFLDKMEEKELDGIIINNLKNVYYLTGFWGSNGTVFISRDRQVLVTDARYIIAASKKLLALRFLQNVMSWQLSQRLQKTWVFLVSGLKMKFRFLITTACKPLLKVWN